MALDNGAAVLTLAGSTQLSDEAVDRGIALLAGSAQATQGAEAADMETGSAPEPDARATGESGAGASCAAGTHDATGSDEAGCHESAIARDTHQALSAETRATLSQAMGQRLRRAMSKPTTD